MAPAVSAGPLLSTTTARKRGRAGEPEDVREMTAARLPVQEEDLTCAICCDVLLDPCVGPCGHDFCWTCLESWRKASADRGPLKCPACRQRIPLDGTTLGVCQRLKRVVEALCPEAVARRRLELQVAAEVAEVVAATSDDLPGEAVPLTAHAPRQRQRLQMPLTGRSNDDASLQVLLRQQLPAHAAVAPSSSHGACPTGTEHTAAPSDAFVGAIPVTAHRVDRLSESVPAVRPMQATTAHIFPASGLQGTWLQNVPPRQPWHDAAADLDARLACAKGLIALMRSWGIGAHDASALLRAVRGLEVLLYRVAPSRQVHAEPSTLQGRIKDLMHLRAAGFGSGALI